MACWLVVPVPVLLGVGASEALLLGGCVALGVRESEDVCVMTTETLWLGLRDWVWVNVGAWLLDALSVGDALGVGTWLDVCVCVGEGPCDALAVTVELEELGWLAVLELLAVAC